MKLSIIVPCFNEQEVLPIFYDELIKYISQLRVSYEIIFINDGSRDNTHEECVKLKEKDEHIAIIELSRNFGKEAAMLSGLEFSTGDLVVIMDADLQDPPNLLPDMVNYVLNDNFDSVATYRVNRKGEPAIRSFFARKFYKIINHMIEIEIVDGARDYRIMTRDMTNAIISIPEYHRFSKGIFAWVGFKTKYLEYENIERAAGESKWSFLKLFKYAVEGIVAFSTFPLRLATIFGALFSVMSFIYMMYIAIKALLYGDPVAGFPSLIVLISLIGGIQLLLIGVLGEYLSKTYMESKRRPKYIVKKIIK